MRSPFIYAGLAIATVGFIINIADVSPGVKYFGLILCTIGLFAGMPSVFVWYVSSLLLYPYHGKLIIFAAS